MSKNTDTTGIIIGSAMEVLNTLGHGFLEKPYENALAVELELRDLTCRQQSRFDIVYKSKKVGEYVPDLIVEDRVVVDTKVIEKITNVEIGQMINYLRVTQIPTGLVLNFKYPRLQCKRVSL